MMILLVSLPSSIPSLTHVQTRPMNLQPLSIWGIVGQENPNNIGIIYDNTFSNLNKIGEVIIVIP